MYYNYVLKLKVYFILTDSEITLNDDIDCTRKKDISENKEIFAVKVK